MNRDQIAMSDLGDLIESLEKERDVLQLEVQKLRAEREECLNALRLLSDHYDDLSKSNPGFMGKLTLQRYDLWNEALLATDLVLAKHRRLAEGTL